MVAGSISLMVLIIFAFDIYALADIKPSVTPLVSLTTIISIVTLASLVNLLRPGVVLIFILSFLLLIVVIIKQRAELFNILKNFLSIGNVCFISACVFMLIILSKTQPIMHQWDEFSFWGIAAKLVKNHDAIYTYYKSSMLGSSIPPALPILSYFFQWSLPQFSEWLSFYAYDVLFFAVYGAVTSVFDEKKKYGAPIVFFICCLLPYFFDMTGKISHVEAMYISVYSDIPLALLFVGVVAVYFSSVKTDSRNVLPVLPVITMLTFAKDMGLALSCIAIFVIFFDMLVSKNEYSFLKIKGIFGKILATATMLITTGGSFILWSMHINKVLAVNRTEFGGATGMGMGRMLINGVVELLIPSQRSQKFSAILKSMVHAFFNTKVCMIGSGIVITTVISTIFICMFIIGNKHDKLQSIIIYITSFIGFIGYYIFHLFLYVYVFRDDAYTLASYNRYMYVYYIGWFVIALIGLSKVSVERDKPVAMAILTSILLAFFVICGYYLKAENTFFFLDNDSYTIRRNVQDKVEFLKASIDPGKVVLVYNGEDAGFTWFIYTFELTDNYVVQEPYIEVDSSLPEEEQIKAYQKGLREFMKQKNVSLFLMDYSNPVFDARYSQLFDVHPGNFGLGAVGLYNVEYTDDSFACHLVKGTGF